MLKKMGRLYDRFENVFSCITLLAGVSIIFINVVGRFLFNHPLAWADEIYLIILAWSIIIGFSIDMREKAHIDMDVIYNLAGKKLKKAIELFDYLCSLLYGIFIAFYGYQAVALQHKIGRVYPITETHTDACPEACPSPAFAPSANRSRLASVRLPFRR